MDHTTKSSRDTTYLILLLPGMRIKIESTPMFHVICKALGTTYVLEGRIGTGSDRESVRVAQLPTHRYRVESNPTELTKSSVVLSTGSKPLLRINHYSYPNECVATLARTMEGLVRGCGNPCRRLGPTEARGSTEIVSEL